jgi:hypothetical protein
MVQYFVPSHSSPLRKSVSSIERPIPFNANFAEDDDPTIEVLLQLMFPGKDWKFLQLNPECTIE